MSKQNKKQDPTNQNKQPQSCPSAKDQKAPENKKQQPDTQDRK